MKTLRKFTPNRWNWSEKVGKWVYVTLKGSKRIYTYQIEPPEEFIDLTNKMKSLNDELMASNDPDQKNDIFKELQKLANLMQAMRR